MNILIDLDYRPALTPVRDQGARPTCLSFAATTAHEFARDSKVPLSPEYLHHFAASSNSPDGVRIPDVARVLENPGQPAETDCPYYPAGPPSGWTPPKDLALYRRKSESATLEAGRIAALLSSGRIPVAGITVPQPFYSPAPPWVISPEGPIRGLHAVAVVASGSESATRYFLIRNSWGVAWGDGGYAWLDDAFMNQHLRHLLTLTDEVN